MFTGYLFLRFKDGHEIQQINPWQTLMNLQYYIFKHTVTIYCQTPLIMTQGQGEAYI